MVDKYKKLEVPTGMVVDPIALGFGSVTRSASDAEFVVECPFHDDDTPSASFNAAKGLFHCFACGESSNADGIARQTGGSVEFVSPGEVALPRGEKWEEPGFDWRKMLLVPAEGEPKAIEYLQSRNVTQRQAIRWGLFAAPAGVGFPLKDKFGMVVGAQVRLYEPRGKAKYMFYGELPPLWPLETIRDSRPDDIHFLVEGVFGAVRARSAGIKGFATLGAGHGLENVVFIMHGREVRGVFDDDKAGWIASAKLAACGIPCARRTIEADEASKGEWHEFAFDGSRFTTNYEEFLAKMTPKDAERALRTVRRFLKKVRP